MRGQSEVPACGSDWLYSMSKSRRAQRAVRRENFRAKVDRLGGGSGPPIAAPEPPPFGYRLMGISCGSQNLINLYFDYHIRDQPGRFTPRWSLLKEFF